MTIPSRKNRRHNLVARCSRIADDHAMQEYCMRGNPPNAGSAKAWWKHRERIQVNLLVALVERWIDEASKPKP